MSRRSGIDRAFERRLSALVNSREPRVLQEGLKGVEKESLRVTPDGHVEQSPHPQVLGSALAHEHITTDYSEALIELVTPAFSQSWELLQYLCDLHQFFIRLRMIGNELRTVGFQFRVAGFLLGHGGCELLCPCCCPCQNWPK